MKFTHDSVAGTKCLNQGISIDTNSLQTFSVLIWWRWPFKSQLSRIIQCILVSIKRNFLRHKRKRVKSVKRKLFHLPLFSKTCFCAISWKIWRFSVWSTHALKFLLTVYSVQAVLCSLCALLANISSQDPERSGPSLSRLPTKLIIIDLCELVRSLAVSAWTGSARAGPAWANHNRSCLYLI
jgi:hypothetical protein